MLRSDPGAPEAASAMFITISQLAVAAAAALGGLLIDSAGLTSSSPAARSRSPQQKVQRQVASAPSRKPFWMLQPEVRISHSCI